MDVNPAVSSGPAVSLSWDYEDVPITLSISKFESKRPPRRCKEEMQMPRDYREGLLREGGFTRSDLMNSIKDIQMSQKKRFQSRNDCQKAAEVTEWCRRRLLKLTGLRRNYQKDEALLWKQAQQFAVTATTEDKQDIIFEKEEKNNCDLDTNSASFHEMKTTVAPKLPDKHMMTVTQGILVALQVMLLRK
eukprot:CAMPEP_0178925572 /NCGR_PEP_ID=MMETSP0786-20121207/17993_1 /TAXON_ID=186022 /ORGANISM="Thalassionema frauenfeldii, Strain CCMP 1798" /LENGTH=189 /DNA_ID=CAMNT_0020600481 /DNA_START=273 /DNA_END=840 /DNA_ORIENTATION=-